MQLLGGYESERREVREREEESERKGMVQRRFARIVYADHSACCNDKQDRISRVRAYTFNLLTTFVSK